MQRRAFLKLTVGGTLALASRGWAKAANPAKRPNVLILMTDQQFADGMSCVMGKTYLHTPNMDSLAANGMRFTRAYAPNPLCMPMRTSMITGLYPHQTGVQSNGAQKWKSSPSPFLGKLFKDAGYETAYFGKWHIPLNMKKKSIHGFDTFLEKEARLDPKHAAKFLAKKHTKPFLMVASFLGPHEICEWARKQEIPGHQLPGPPPLDKRPPMRENYAIPKNETDIIAYARKSMQANSKFPVGNYTEADWRRHIWGYLRLIERVDGYIGTVLKALRKAGLERNTLVLFLSDHGDCHGAHHWNQKTVFYDESARVPFILSWMGVTPKGTSDSLINTGVDVIPTLCNFAGINPPKALLGMSLKSAAMGKPLKQPREYVVSQNHIFQGDPVDRKHLKPQGRMVRSKRYKYCLYDMGTRRESLVDMAKDPGELVNLANDPKHAKTRQQHRDYLAQFAKETKDTLAAKMLKAVN